ncbi:hypothetical protein ACSQ67_011119 [Phaseolus vulgaris]
MSFGDDLKLRCTLCSIDMAVALVSYLQMEIPDDYFVVLVGDMITEEAPPTYQTMLHWMEFVMKQALVWTRA